MTDDHQAAHGDLAHYAIERRRRADKTFAEWRAERGGEVEQSKAVEAEVWPPQGWRCPECGCRSFCHVSELVEGHFVPGPDIRCLDCKRVYSPPAPDLDLLPGLDLARAIADHWHQRFLALYAEARRPGLRDGLLAKSLGAEQVLDAIDEERRRLGAKREGGR